MATQILEKTETLQKVIEFLGTWQERGKKETQVNTFFQLLNGGKRTAAKIVLDKIKQKSETSLWHHGYINALEGMFYALETKEDKEFFINQIKLENSEMFRRKFFQQSKNELQTDFDRGYFSAWIDYLQVFKKPTKSK